MILILFWLFVSLGSIILELTSPGFFYFLSVSIGASFACVASIWIDLFSYQLGSALLVAVLSFFCLRHYTKKMLLKTLARTNSDFLIGKIVNVTHAILPPHAGRIQYAGDSWVAFCAQPCEKGDRVEIQQVVRAHVIVKKL